MSLIEAVAESPVSLVLVVAAVSVAVIREIAASLEKGGPVVASKQAVITFLALLASFLVVSATRVILILR